MSHALLKIALVVGFGILSQSSVTASVANPRASIPADQPALAQVEPNQDNLQM